MNENKFFEDAKVYYDFTILELKENQFSSDEEDKK